MDYVGGAVSAQLASVRNSCEVIAFVDLTTLSLHLEETQKLSPVGLRRSSIRAQSVQNPYELVCIARH